MRLALKSILGAVTRQKAKLLFILLRLGGIVFGFMPRRLALFLIVVLTVLRLPGKTIAAKAFYPLVIKHLYHKPDIRFSSPFSRFFPVSEIKALRIAGAFEETCERALDSGVHMAVPEAAYDLSVALFELGQFDRAREVMNTFFAPSQLVYDADAAHFAAQLDLLAHDIPSAAANLRTAAQELRGLMRPHQNMAARYPFRYKPNDLDGKAGKWGLVYSAANFVGQKVTQVGHGQFGPPMYDIAMEAQKQLAADTPVPSNALQGILNDLDIRYEDLVLLPEEWAVQIGHIGMLDMLFRMREIGWWHGKTMMLTRRNMIANHAMLRLYGKESAILTLGVDINPAVSAELVSMEFWKAMTFNAFKLPDGEVVPWQDAGAKMMQMWESEGRGYPLRDEFDQQLGGSASLAETARRMKQRIGIPEDAWYVCLHVRDAAHYSELPGMGQTHRNADIQNYIKAVEYITSQGGWVIKLGGPKSPKLPKMPRVFDYTRSSYRSNIMDMLLIRHARFFIGATSGLTNVAVSFGVPCALVNCITTDAQLWGDRVRFALKWIKLRDGSLVNQRGMTTAPWRWRVFNAELLWRNGATVEESSPEEILETVKEVEALATGRTDEYLANFPDADKTLEDWKASLSVPYYYGNALPSMYWARKHPELLAPSVQEGDLAESASGSGKGLIEA